MHRPPEMLHRDLSEASREESHGSGTASEKNLRYCMYSGFCDTPSQKAKKEKGTLQAYTQTCIHACYKKIKKYKNTLRLKRLVSEQI